MLGTNYTGFICLTSFAETMDYLVLETMNKAKTSPVFVEQRHLIERVECFCPSAFVKAVPGWMPSHISRCYLNDAFENTEYDSHNMSDCDVNDSIFLSENQRYNCPISWCAQSHRHSRLCSRVKAPRVRDREPYRISLRKRIHSLKCRKLRRQHKKKLRQSVPVSSVLHSIAANYKYWNMKYVQRQDGFYSNYFKRTRKSTITHNVSGKNILLSGDVELNPGPVIFNDVSTVQNTSFEAPDFTFQYRLLRYRLRPLDVGGGGDCFFKSTSHQIRVMIYK